MQLDGVLERRVGVGEHLVDDHVFHRQIIGFARRGGAGEFRDPCGAVGQPPLRFAGDGFGDQPLVQERLCPAVKGDRFTKAGQAEIDVVAALGQVGVRDPFHEPPAGDVVEFRDLKLGAADRADVVGQVQPVHPNRLRLRVVQLDPVAAAAVGHPLVDDKIGRGGQRCGKLVLLARSGGVEQRPVAVFVAADGTIRHLEAVADSVDNLFVRVEQVHGAVSAIERAAGVQVIRRAKRGVAGAVAPHEQPALDAELGAVGEAPLPGLDLVDAQAHAGEIDGRRGVVPDLDPVAGPAKRVDDGRVVDRKKFAELQAVGLGQVVGLAGADGGGERGPRAGAVRVASTGLAVLLRAVAQVVEFRAVGVTQQESSTGGGQLEIEVPNAGFFVGAENLITARRNKREAAVGELGQAGFPREAE